MHPLVAESIAAASVSFQDQARLAEHARQAAIGTTGAEDVVFACSLPALIEAVAQLTDFSLGLVVSRTDAIRVPGFTDVRELLARSNNNLVEIGAVNGASAADWTAALRSNRQAAVLVSPNCLETSEAALQRAHAVAAASQTQASVVEILFDATIRKDLASALGIPTVQQSLSNGADVVIAPLDWLIGGPTGAMVAGKSSIIAALRSLLDSRGLLLRGSGLAGVAACFSTSEASVHNEAGVAKLLLTNTANLADRARRIVAQIDGTARVRSATVTERSSKLGPAPWNRYSIPSFAVGIEPLSATAVLRSELERLSPGPAILTTEAAGKVLLDLRLVDPSQDHYLVLALLGKTEPETSS